MIRLRRKPFDAECIARGLASDAARARALGVDRTTLYRVTTGATAPSNEFMAAVAVTFRGRRLDDFFEVA